MTMGETIRGLLRYSGINYKQFGMMCGHISGEAISLRLTNDNITIDNAVSMLSILGYELLVRPSKAGRRKADEIIITARENNVD